jgi:uncharacterized glyoxalase superfamily protein PhnB
MIMTLVVVSPFISFSIDRLRKALYRFYKRRLNGKITFMLTWSEWPVADNVLEKRPGNVAHSMLVTSATNLQGSDSTPASYRVPRGLDIGLGSRPGRAIVN